jgi:N-acetylglucosaminyldiphosphoundecaprenol N-acetyl-beta-D-mannosaminyltransferase
VQPERTAMTNEPETRDIFGIPVRSLTLSGTVALVDTAIRTRTRLMIGVINAAKVVNMRRDPALRRSVMSSDVILADGFSIVMAARLLGRPLPERVAGIDLMEAILVRASERHYRVYCLGATEAVLAAVHRHIARVHPGVQVVGSHHGYFAPEQEPDVAGAIRDSRADVLFVAMTSPKKERFLLRWEHEIDVPVRHGVGGSFDVLAGSVRRAPQAWQRLGLEWLYRTLQEPRRLWKRYLVTNCAFLGMLFLEVCREAPQRMAVRLRGPA